MPHIFKTAIGVLVLAVGLVGSVVAGPLEDGLDAFTHHDYETAIRVLRPFAERANAAAQFALGRMYEEGDGVPQNYAAAVIW
jgi:TPR repeat protein